MSTFNIKIFREEILRAAASNRGLINIAFENARESFGNEKEVMLQEFRNHPVTLELKEGSINPLGTANISNTLDGRGNLFTFIGFNQGENPAAELEAFIDISTYVKPSSRGARYNRDSISYQFPVYVAGTEEIANATPMPFEPGSWVKKIERYIIGLGAYIYWKAAGRSGGGLEAKTPDGKVKILRPNEFKPIKYLTPILRKFRLKFFRGRI